jgi:hypothetical protein
MILLQTMTRRMRVTPGKLTNEDPSAFTGAGAWVGGGDPPGAWRR